MSAPSAPKRDPRRWAAPVTDPNECPTAKIPYASKREANEAVRAWRRRGRTGYSAYRCKLCPAWHLTSRARKRRLG